MTIVTRIYLMFMILSSFKQLIKEQTGVSLGSRTIIDHVASNLERNSIHYGAT